MVISIPVPLTELAGRMMRTWTYEQVTEATQHRIRTLLQPRSGGTHEDAVRRRAWAWGAFIMWYQLTLGPQEEGDAEAMVRLANGEVR